MKIEVVRGSVLEQDVEAIVNAANTGMRGGGALDGAVHRAAGPALLEELKRVAPDGARTAQVVVTRAYDLPQKWVFHVAGPVWSEKNAVECDELLCKAYRGCLDEASSRSLESVAFPSLSTGVYAFPLQRAASLALQMARDFALENPQTSLRRVVFALFGDEEYRIFSRIWETLTRDG